MVLFPPWKPLKEKGDKTKSKKRDIISERVKEKKLEIVKNAPGRSLKKEAEK